MTFRRTNFKSRRTRKTKRTIRTRKHNRKTRKHYKKYKGGVGDNFDTNFVRCYQDNLTKVMSAIQNFSGTHSINQEIASQFINEQLTDLRKQAARDLIENTIYITLQETSDIVEKLIVRLYTENNLNEAETIYFYSGTPNKSFYFLSILALYYIRKHGFKEPTHFIKKLEPELFEEIGNSPLIILDDVSYSGSQLSNMLHSIYYDLVIKQKQKPPNIFILLVALNDFSKQKLEGVPTKASKFANYPAIYIMFIPSPFKLLFLPERLYTPLIMKVGIERYFYISVFFSIYTVDVPNISLYLDHKIADAVSTYKKVLTYGPIIPSNFDLTKFFTTNYFDNETYDIIPSHYYDMNGNTHIPKLLNDFNSANETSYTSEDDIKMSRFILNKLIESESQIDKESYPYIRFRPFINGCNSNPRLLQNINDPEIIGFDYLLFMADDGCIADKDCSIKPTLSTLQEIVENSQISKQKAIEISDRINNFSCPESWYKSGEFQMTCLSE
jgi:hypothetical protein